MLIEILLLQCISFYFYNASHCLPRNIFGLSHNKGTSNPSNPIDMQNYILKESYGI